MTSTDSNALLRKSKTMSCTKEENTTTTTTLPPDKGLAELPTLPKADANKKVKVLQKAQVNSMSGVKKLKESKDRTPPSPVVLTHHYALEV